MLGQDTAQKLRLRDLAFGKGGISTYSFPKLYHLFFFKSFLHEVPDYRLSPKSVFPDALEDCFKVYFDLVYEYKIPPEKICLGGDSAGGNLCVSLLKKLHEHSIEKPKAVILNSPWIDLKFRGASW